MPRAQKQNGSIPSRLRSVLTVARLCLGLKTEKNVLSDGFRSVKPLQRCDFAPNAFCWILRPLEKVSKRSLVDVL